MFAVQGIIDNYRDNILKKYGGEFDFADRLARFRQGASSNDMMAFKQETERLNKEVVEPIQKVATEYTNTVKKNIDSMKSEIIQIDNAIKAYKNLSSNIFLSQQYLGKKESAYIQAKKYRDIGGLFDPKFKPEKAEELFKIAEYNLFVAQKQLAYYKELEKNQDVYTRYLERRKELEKELAFQEEEYGKVIENISQILEQGINDPNFDIDNIQGEKGYNYELAKTVSVPYSIEGIKQKAQEEFVNTLKGSATIF
jgi:phage host-nuclease inhibitor protein Gam